MTREKSTDRIGRETAFERFLEGYGSIESEEEREAVEERFEELWGDSGESNHEDTDRMPQQVMVNIKPDVAMKNLEANGQHHIFGDDGTHVVLELVEDDDTVEWAESHPVFQIVEDDQPNTLLGMFSNVFR